MARSYYSKSISQFLQDANESILGQLTRNHEFNLEEQQKNAWISQIEILKTQLTNTHGHIIFEYSIPRMGKRVDVILIYKGIIFVLEFKVGDTNYERHAIDQVLDYAVDLKNFQEGSHNLLLVPILIATNAEEKNDLIDEIYSDKISKPLLCNSKNISIVIERISSKYPSRDIEPHIWENSQYKPHLQ